MLRVSSKVLAVDLDGTLLRSDMLFETFWNACARDWRTPFKAIAALFKGKANVKNVLANICEFDASILPYNDEVVAYVKSWRARGGRTALVTATSQHVADRIAEHLGIFDEVHGSTESLNLKGSNKSAFLESHYGEGMYAYVGDSLADMHVWAKASHIVAISPSSRLGTRIERLGRSHEIIAARGSDWKVYVKQLRPHQWSKNLLIFVPMLATHSGDLATIIRTILAFFSFSLVASSVYVLNDLLDLAADRAHARKKRRPLASGDLPIAHGTALFPLLLGTGVVFGVLAGVHFLAALALYYTVTLAYSFYLKRKILIDICALAGLYTLRIIAGSAVTGIHLSVWLLAFSTFLFFSLAAVKRQSELNHHALSGHNALVGRGYRVQDLPIISQMGIASGYIAVMVLALYIDAPTTAQLYSFPEALWGICLVLLFWISRMVFITNRGRMHDDPVFFALKDRVSRYCGIIIGLFALASVSL